jgi:hypothetical protein
MMHCEEATRTLSAAQERPLTVGERIALRLHLAFCSHCRHFGQQVTFLRDTMRAYARRPDAPAAGKRDDHDASSE